MSLKARLTEDMKQALKAGDKSRLSVVRMALAAIKQREVDDRVELDDGEIVGVIENAQGRVDMGQVGERVKALLGGH
jgi:uncharacterized protein YqeY